MIIKVLLAIQLVSCYKITTAISPEQPPPGTPPPPPYTGELWPDFRCVPGWYDEQTGEVNDPAAPTPRSAGTQQLRKLHGDCANYAKSQAPRSQWPYDTILCAKTCIMGHLGLFNTTSFDAPSADDMKKGFGDILTDKGGAATLADLVDNFYPEWSAPDNWNYRWAHPKECDNFFWSNKLSLIDNYLTKIREPSCVLQLKEADNAIYRARGHIRYTAELDLSCYVDFTYKGIEWQDGGNMDRFVGPYNDCNELILRKGLKSDCMAICMFHRLGLFQWHILPNIPVPTLADISPGINHTSTEHLGTRFFGWSYHEKDFAERGKLMDKECRPIFERVHSQSCADMQELADCIERVFSCNYTGKFLRNQTQLERSQQPKKGKLIMEHQGFPDMSCRQGYQKSQHPKKGSGLLKRTSISCRSLMEAGYHKCEKMCILDELGILVANGTGGDGGEEEGGITRYRFNDEQEIIPKLGDILGDFGGWDTSNQIAADLGSCKHSLQQLQLGEPNCDSMEWSRFSLCVSRAMECKASILFGHFRVWDEDWLNMCDDPAGLCDHYQRQNY